MSAARSPHGVGAATNFRKLASRLDHQVAPMNTIEYLQTVQSVEDEWGSSLETLDPIDERNMIGGIRIGTATTVLVRTMRPRQNTHSTLWLRASLALVDTYNAPTRIMPRPVI